MVNTDNNKNALIKTEDFSKKHWEEIFQNKDTSKVSWFQARPQQSLDLIEKYTTSKTKAIIDVGGGDSRLADYLIEQGYEDISVLDISEHALQESKKRLGKHSVQVKWISSNILNHETIRQYDIWHDRAVFHFLTLQADQLLYKEHLLAGLSSNGVVILGTFSKNDGPKKCSGLNIQQYDRESIEAIFLPEFEIVNAFEATHETPAGSKQNFCWSVLKLKN